MNKRIWFITGISSGLGKALASAVMDNGDFVIGTFRNSSQVDEFNSSNANKGYAVKLDITNEKEIEKTIALVIKKFGRIDVLVNNAGVD